MPGPCKVGSSTNTFLDVHHPNPPRIGVHFCLPAQNILSIIATDFVNLYPLIVKYRKKVRCFRNDFAK